jgi:hypothetical protein
MTVFFYKREGMYSYGDSVFSYKNTFYLETDCSGNVVRFSASNEDC